MMHPSVHADACGQAPGAKPVSPIRALASAHDDVMSLVQRVRVLADRLVGSVPEKADSVEPVQPGAIFPAMQMAAQQQRRAIGQAHDALTRIEAQLP